jgi:UrcA family protein
MNRCKLISILVFAACTLQSGWAAAGPDDQVRTRAVHYSDLDLSRPADAAVLYGRIERAADYVCGPFTTSDLSRFYGFKRCKTAAVAQALADVHAPVVTDRRAAQTVVRTVGARGAALSR